MSRIAILKWIAIGFLIGFGAGVYYSKWLNRWTKYYGKEKNELVNVVETFNHNSVTGVQSRSYRLFSDSMLAVYRKRGVIDSVSYANFVLNGEGWLDSANVLGLSLLSPDRAKVFVKEFGPDTSIFVYYLVKQSAEWKLNGFDFVGMIKYPDTTMAE